MQPLKFYIEPREKCTELCFAPAQNQFPEIHPAIYFDKFRSYFTLF